MSRYNTGAPVPSNQVKDFSDNAQIVDEIVHLQQPSTLDRFGNQLKTWYGIQNDANQAISTFESNATAALSGFDTEAKSAIASFGYITLDSFELGAEITLRNEVLRFESSGEYYRWDGVLPKIVTAGSTPESSGGVGLGAWLSVGDSTLRQDLNRFLWEDRLEIVIAKMASQQTVKIACYGDSTTDGNGTTGWVANPVDVDGNAVGNTDHNLTAPNAWPVKLQAILRNMYSNNNIFVFNAGYSGQRIDTGWAYSNYDKAITNNPYYGVCDAVIIDFGLNDIQDGLSILSNYVSQSENLIRKILSQGSVPLLLTSGPEYRDVEDGGVRDNEQISQQINVAKLSISNKYGLTLIDKALEIKNWLSKNIDGVTWAAVQPDALHFSDLGHGFQASFISSMLYGDIINVRSGCVENISFMDSRSNSPAGNVQVFKPIGTKFGANPLYETSFISSNFGRAVVRQWVYCHTPDIGAAYMAVDADYQSIYSQSNNSRIKITAISSGASIYDNVPVNTGFITTSGSLRYSDTPIFLGGLQYGLNLVEYKLPNNLSVLEAGKVYHGWFKFADGMQQVRTQSQRFNLLKDTGEIYYSTSSASGAITINGVSSLDNLSNGISFYQGATQALLLELDIPVGYGVEIMGGNKGVETAAPTTVDSGFMLYRNTSTTVGIYPYKKMSDGSVTYSGALLNWNLATGTQKVRMDFLVGSSSENIINIYTGWTTSTLMGSIQINKGNFQLIPAGGIFGGVFVNTGVSVPGTAIHVAKAFVYKY